MGWGIGPDRFMTGNRGWLPRWRFQPTETLDDAFRLLKQAGPREFSICGDDKGGFQVQVQIDVRTGKATGESIATTIAMAVARAVGLEVPDRPDPVLGKNDGVSRASRSRHDGK
jgi:hypothetical protein